MSRDPFAGYDAWLERPYQERYAQGDREEAAWEHRGISPDDIDPPHKPGDACPKCGEPGALENHADYDPGDMLCCTACGREVEPDEKPSFDISDYIAGLEEEDAERRAEARMEARMEDDR